MNNAAKVLPLTSPLAVAAALAKRGFRVFPLKPGEKRPRFKGWWRDATANWFDVLHNPWPPDSWPSIATGDWLLVIDVDAGKGGLEELAKLGLPPTFTVRTANGGLHLYFRVPPGRRFQSRACRIGKDGRKHYAIRGVWGIDVRAEGGLVVGPGGEFNGKPYAVEKDIAIADAPEPLMSILELAPAVLDGGGKVADGVQLDAPWAVARAEKYLETEAGLAIEGEGGDCQTIAVANRVFDFGISCLRWLNLRSGNARTQVASPTAGRLRSSPPPAAG